MMTELLTLVVCRSEDIASRWKSLSVHYAGLEIRCLVGELSLYNVINRAIADAQHEHVMIIHDDVWPSTEIGKNVSALIFDLDLKYKNWGLCGNVGVRWDGVVSARHITDPHGGPIPFVGPRPVTSIDGNVMLLNCRNLRQKGLTEIPDLGGYHGYDLVLSYEALRHSLTVLVDPRLYVKHTSGGNQQAFDNFAKIGELSSYLSENFVDHRFDTVNGPITLDDRQNYPFLTDINKSVGQTSSHHVRVLDCYDQALGEARNGNSLSLTLVVRTQMKRRALFERLAISVSQAVADARDLIDVKLLVVSDQPSEALVSFLQPFHEITSPLKIDHITVGMPTGRASRVELALEAFSKLNAGYVWFIDDDDYLLPNSIRAVARTLIDTQNYMLTVDCLRMIEVWEGQEANETLKKSTTLDRTDGSLVYRAFDGDNFVPFCGVVFPCEAMRSKLQGVSARMSYYEDYFLLLLALSVPAMCCETISEMCCGISVRGADNTITEKDRTVWNISHSTVLGEILANPSLSVPVAWARFRLPEPVDHRFHSQIFAVDSGNIRNGLICGNEIELVEDGSIIGYWDTMDFEQSELIISGWASNIGGPEPISKIVVAIEDAIIGECTNFHQRNDLPNTAGSSEENLCGFRMKLKSPLGWRLNALPKVIAISERKAVTLKAGAEPDRRLVELIHLHKNGISQDDFDEKFYLRVNRDVREAVSEGVYSSGFEHWLLFGFGEKRAARLSSEIKLSPVDIAHTCERYGFSAAKLNS